MKGKLKNILIIGIIVIILLLPIVISYINGKKVTIKEFEKFREELASTTFSLVYFGDTDSENYEKYKDTLIELRSKYGIDVYAVNNTQLKDSEYLLSISNEFANDSAYAVIRDGEVFKVISGSAKKDVLDNSVNKFYKNVITGDDIAYKTVSTYKDYMALVNSKKITMAVFGRNSCSWCNRYKPVYNDVAEEMNLDIYYFDSDSFNSTEYSKILNSGLTIPANCTNTKKEELLSYGFGTPLTIITKEGKTIGCIGGYVNKSTLLSKLQEVGLIK